MKFSFLQTNNKKKSIDNKHSFKTKDIKSDFNKSVIFNRSTINTKIKRNLRKYKGEDKITILSNANVNILQILNNCVDEEILNDSTILIENNNNDEKEKSLDNISKNITEINVNPINDLKKKKHKKISLKNKFGMTSNIGNTNSEIIISKIRKNSNKSNYKSNYGYQSKNKKSDKYLNSINKSKTIKKQNKNRHSNEIRLNKFNLQTQKFRKRSNSIGFFNNFAFGKDKKKEKLEKNSNTNITSEISMENDVKYKGFLNEIEIMKINENIHDDINFIKLKKKITQLKKNIQKKSSTKSFINYRSIKRLDSGINKNSTIEEAKEKSEQTSIVQNSDFDSQNLEINKIHSNKIKKSISHEKNLISKDKFRYLKRNKNIYDSFDDEEYIDEDIDFYISPDSLYVKIFDSLLFLASMIYLIFIPYFLSKNYFFIKENNFLKTIFLIIDIIYIVDIIVNFFRSYHNFDENLVRKKREIFSHYLKTWFILDFIQAIPYYSVIYYMEKYMKTKNQISSVYFDYNINPILYIVLLVKIIKVYKMLYSNSTISYFSEIISKNEFFDDHGAFIILFFITLLVINMTTCLFIFIGTNTYPGWIIKLNIQDNSYLHIYLVSIYFIIVTITTVGYGDITGETLPEIFFQIYLLIIGTIAYSFTISYISNYIIKSNQKSLSFEKNLEILQEIRIQHPNMKNTLYIEILRNIYNEQLYERKDKHLLFDCLPYSLKNKLISEMYKPIIKNFVFFKDIDNSDFIVKVMTSLKPVISLKGDIIIQEGDFIKEIFFVKKGVIGLNICVDLNNPELSLKKYLGQGGIGKFDIAYKSNINNQSKNFSDLNLDSLINENMNSFSRSHHIYANIENIENIKVIDIRAREHFGML